MAFSETHEFTSEEILYMIVEYLGNKFNLYENSNSLLFCDKELKFTCKDKNTMDSVSSLTLDELFESCNDITYKNINCKEGVFENIPDLVEELNLFFNGDIVAPLSKALWNKFEVMCIASNT